jgi:hypothetical protein
VNDDPEQIAALLGRHYVEGTFDADELSRRLDLAYAADDTALDGLPTLPAHIGKERRRWGRRHGEANKVQPGWVPTKERFVDPGTQRIMRVWVDPVDHSRHYVPETS